MRVAILSDSHGNLTALDAVLQEIDRTGPYDAVMVGGDVAYGGPFPAQCIERIMERGLPAVRGNTDQEILDSVGSRGDAHINWVLDQLDERHIDFLKTFSVQHNMETSGDRMIGIVHATPWSIYDSVLPDSSDFEFRRMLMEADVNLLLYGHIHLQHQRALDTGVVVAVGSLGMPFDGDQRAMYTVVEAGAGGFNVEFHRLEYDVEKAISEARALGGPNGETFARSLASAARP